jgi:hypothetical protein
MSRVERHVPEVVYVEPKVFIPYKQGIYWNYKKYLCVYIYNTYVYHLEGIVYTLSICLYSIHLNNEIYELIRECNVSTI